MAGKRSVAGWCPIVAVFVVFVATTGELFYCHFLQTSAVEVPAGNWAKDVAHFDLFFDWRRRPIKRRHPGVASPLLSSIVRWALFDGALDSKRFSKTHLFAASKGKANYRRKIEQKKRIFTEKNNRLLYLFSFFE